MRFTPLRTAMVVVLALVLAAGITACGSKKKSSSSSAAPTGQPGKGKPALTLGSKNFTEELLLGQLYKQALEAKGFTVKIKENIGSTEIIDKALTSGQIDAYPEYEGILLTGVAHDNKRYKSEQEAYDAAKAFEEKRGFTILQESSFSNTDALAVKPPYAQKNSLKAIPDLKKVKHFTYGAPPENKTRFEGVVGLKQVYGLSNFTFKPLAIGLQYKAIDNGNIDVADVFTTDGQLQGGKYVVLSDPQNVMGFQHMLPVVSKKTLAAQGPAFAQTLNAVNAKLTTEAMQKMNGAVDLDKQSPDSVAGQFLSANGLK